MIFVYSKIVNVFSLINKGKCNINGVPINKGQFEAVIDSNVSRMEYVIQLVNILRNLKTISVIL